MFCVWLNCKLRNTLKLKNDTKLQLTGEKQSFLTPEPVRLTPAWEAGNLPNDELNLKGITMEEAQLECSQPKDKYNIVYLILLLHGIGTLLPWNMFITAKSVHHFCSDCGEFETIEHLFMPCPAYMSKRKILFERMDL